MRVYMVDNKAGGINTNNDNMQMTEDLDNCDFLYGQEQIFAKSYERMNCDNFRYAASFCILIVCKN